MNAIQETHRAAREGDLGQLRSLIATDPGLLQATDDESPFPTSLHQAAARGQIEAVLWLLEQGADARWHGPQTPLHVAWQRPDNMPVIHALVAHGAAHSGIFAAVYLDDQEQVAALVGADPDSVHERDDAGMTPLHRAAENGQRAMVEALIGHGADVEARTPDGQTPLQRAYYHPHILEALLAHGASIDVITAINVGRDDLLAGLLERDSGLVHTTMRGQTPLQFAVQAGDPALTRLLLDHGADLHARGGWKGWTPLHWAAYRGRAAVVELLLARGADPRAVDQEGRLPRDLALQHGQDQVADLLQVG